MDEWYVRDRGRILGPFTAEQVKAMRARGQVQPFHELSRDRRTWQPADAPVETPAATRASPTPPSPPAAKRWGTYEYLFWGSVAGIGLLFALALLVRLLFR